MTAEAVGPAEARPYSRPTRTIDSKNLYVGHVVAELVDFLMPEPAIIGVTLRHLPTPDDKTAGNLLISATEQQLDMFSDIHPHALSVYQEAVQSKMSERAIESVMKNFVAMQKLRHGRGIS